MSLVLPDPGPVNEAFERPASRERLERTAGALTRVLLVLETLGF
jgi:hypothetical protein